MSIHSLSAFYQAYKRHQSNQGCRDLPLPRHILEFFQEETKLGKRHYLSSVPWICTGLSTQMNILETPRRHVVSVVFTHLNHLNWLPLMWRSTLNMKTTKPSSISKTEPRHLLKEALFCCTSNFWLLPTSSLRPLLPLLTTTNQYSIYMTTGLSVSLSAQKLNTNLETFPM